MKRRIRRNQPLPGPYYVWMTDKFMSGWGRAEGLISKFVVKCRTFEQAECIVQNAEKRNEMRGVNFGRKLPYFSPRKYIVSMKTWEQLGDVWKERCVNVNRRRVRRNPGFDPATVINKESIKREFLAGYKSGMDSRIQYGAGMYANIIKAQERKNEIYLTRAIEDDYERKHSPRLFAMKFAYHFGWRKGWNGEEPQLKYLPKKLK